MGLDRASVVVAIDALSPFPFYSTKSGIYITHEGIAMLKRRYPIPVEEETPDVKSGRASGGSRQACSQSKGGYRPLHVKR